MTYGEIAAAVVAMCDPAKATGTPSIVIPAGVPVPVLTQQERNKISRTLNVRSNVLVELLTKLCPPTGHLNWSVVIVKQHPDDIQLGVSLSGQGNMHIQGKEQFAKNWLHSLLNGVCGQFRRGQATERIASSLTAIFLEQAHPFVQIKVNAPREDLLGVDRYEYPFMSATDRRRIATVNYSNTGELFGLQHLHCSRGGRFCIDVCGEGDRAVLACTKCSAVSVPFVIKTTPTLAQLREAMQQAGIEQPQIPPTVLE